MCNSPELLRIRACHDPGRIAAHLSPIAKPTFEEIVQESWIQFCSKEDKNEGILTAGIIALVLYLKSAAFVVVASSILSACSFRYDPAAAVQYYRAEGWKLPGISDPSDPDVQHVYPPPSAWTRVPGAVAKLLKHEYPYILEFPAQGFALDGARKKMRRMVTKATIVRWQVGDRVVAYSYNLIPLEAKRKKGKWVVQHEMGCIFPATFIDDRGDGVFRILVQRDLTPDLLPAWAKPNPI